MVSAGFSYINGVLLAELQVQWLVEEKLVLQGHKSQISLFCSPEHYKGLASLFRFHADFNHFSISGEEQVEILAQCIYFDLIIQIIDVDGVPGF